MVMPLPTRRGKLGLLDAALDNAAALSSSALLPGRQPRRCRASSIIGDLGRQRPERQRCARPEQTSRPSQADGRSGLPGRGDQEIVLFGEQHGEREAPSGHRPWRRHRS